MDDKHLTDLDPPVEFLQIGWGNYTSLPRVSDLARCLVRDFPEDGRGDDYLTALMVCHAVMIGSEDDTAEDARASFVAAAHEAGLTVIPDDGPEF